MKRTQLIAAVALAYTLTACGEAPKKEAETKEQPQKETVEKKEEAPKAEPLSEEAKKLAKKWRMAEFTHTDGKTEKASKEQIMELKADGSFELFQNKNSVAKGTWTLAGKALTLKHTAGTETGQTEKMTVAEASEKRLVTKDDDGKMTEVYEAIE